MALGKVHASAITPQSTPLGKAPEGLRNIGSKGPIADIAGKLPNNDKPLSAGDLTEALKDSGLSSELQKSIAGLAPTDNVDKASTAQATQAASAAHNQFAFNLPGQNQQKDISKQIEESTNKLNDGWQNTGASLS
jgi:hypothetical protein